MSFFTTKAAILIVQFLPGILTSSVIGAPFNVQTNKELLDTKRTPNIAFTEDVGFPGVQYSSSIIDFNNSPQYNIAFDTTEIDASKITKAQMSTTSENILENYKRKQRLRDMNFSMKKVFNKTLSFDDYSIPINISQSIPKKMIKLQDDLIISKYINKKPFNFCEYAIDYTSQAPSRSKLENQIIINKFINKKPYMTPEARKQEQFRKYSNLLGVIDHLIVICEHIFNGIVDYVYGNYGNIMFVPPKEASEILEIVDKLKQVLDILDFLSANIVWEYNEFCQGFNDTTNNTQECVNVTSVSPVDEVPKNESISVYSSPTIHIVDEAIGTIELILKTALPSNSSTESNSEESRAIMSRLENLKTTLRSLETTSAGEISALDKNGTKVGETSPQAKNKNS